MRLSLRRVQPGPVFSSFFGILDIKLGCEIILLFGLINKVAGVYGLITVFIGGSFAQIVFYAYSVLSLVGLQWGLKQVKAETSHKCLLVAHLYALDNVIQQVFHYAFFYNYWYIQKHEGQRDLHSQAQKDIFELAVSRGEVSASDANPSEAEAQIRAGQAMQIWNDEKGYALGVIFLGFLFKVYACMVLYSYAAHLRTNTYHSLPLTKGAHAARDAITASRSQNVIPIEEDEVALAEAEIARDRARENGHLSHSQSPSRSPRTSPDKSMAGLPRTDKDNDQSKRASEDDFSWD
ncbi:uncharacterized protein CcaverHIS019_0204690 [Cutaneotrichosporon cavernicola]|uniref:DUF1753-domain-containing protein n=1 Tax=Cutaneotrichosporon cavernicola TaxID=279322 RepID=A0AA48L1K8_9TREE|nr:uncharacterized protein CcaverHIS019_0204690 [Cutaneotrichosporon cavernicola]BEI89107.1 hypothetical protein CcaverHIS019_0204690 [Cutaneotrichosporon cavernicola]BEJ04655.1 hypothetical protein CcaverHIS641_0204720 [Cutaneotrichosporon cavernicola]